MAGVQLFSLRFPEANKIGVVISLLFIIQSFVQRTEASKFRHYPFDTFEENNRLTSHIFDSFEKPCHATPNDCIFRLDHLSLYNEVYLECGANGFCRCSPLIEIADVPVWNLIWDSNSQSCTISEFGPCGENNDLRIECQGGLLCMGSRCRNPRKLHLGQEHYFCFDDIDCEKHLKCLPSDLDNQRICELPNSATPKKEEEEVSTAVQRNNIYNYSFKPTTTRTPILTSNHSHNSHSFQIHSTTAQIQTTSQPYVLHTSAPQIIKSLTTLTSNPVSVSGTRNFYFKNDPQDNSPGELVLNGRNSEDAYQRILNAENDIGTIGSQNNVTRLASHHQYNANSHTPLRNTERINQSLPPKTHVKNAACKNILTISVMQLSIYITFFN